MLLSNSPDRAVLFPDHCLDNLYFVVGQPEQFRHDFVDQRVGVLDFCH